MEYVKPSMKVSRLNIAARLLAGSYVQNAGAIENLSNTTEKGSNTKRGDDEQPGGGYMLSRSRTYFN